MKLPALLLALLSLPAFGQEPAAPQTLTPEQLTNVLKQITQLEDQIAAMRDGRLAAALQKIRAGVASPRDALNLFMECDKIVNADRKELDKAEARRRQEMMERREKNDNAEDDGQFSQAVQLGLKYLALTLEANELKAEDKAAMIPKLQAYIQELVASAPNLRGRSLQYLASAVNDRNPIVDALRLSPFTKPRDWSPQAMDIGGMYKNTLLPTAEKYKPELLPTLWTERINAESALRKETMPAPEYELWLQDDVPALRWERASYLVEKGPSKINAMADMLALIKEFPGHADAPGWLSELRKSLNEVAPEAPSPNLPK
jgi:hypothetical protein